MTKKWNGPLVLVALIGMGLIPTAGLAECTSAFGCAWCGQDQNGHASCRFGDTDGFCSCTIDVSDPDHCQMSGICSYQPPGGGGGGGCTRLPGEWCPPSCFSCTIVYFSAPGETGETEPQPARQEGGDEESEDTNRPAGKMAQ